MIVIGLSCSRIESRRLYSFLKKDKKISVDFESDIKKFSWYDSENLIMKRIDYLENRLYKNTNKNKYSIFAEVSFYMLPYFELIASKHLIPSGITSLPIPSPAITAMEYLFFRISNS